MLEFRYDTQLLIEGHDLDEDVISDYFTENFKGDCLLAAIPTIQVEMTSNWNHRYRENMERMKSGDLLEVARVIKGLTARDMKRGLSTGERKMLHAAKQILISEIVLSKSVSYESAEEALNTALA